MTNANTTECEHCDGRGGRFDEIDSSGGVGGTECSWCDGTGRVEADVEESAAEGVAL